MHGAVVRSHAQSSCAGLRFTSVSSWQGHHPSRPRSPQRARTACPRRPSRPRPAQARAGAPRRARRRRPGPCRTRPRRRPQCASRPSRPRCARAAARRRTCRRRRARLQDLPHAEDFASHWHLRLPAKPARECGQTAGACRTRLSECRSERKLAARRRGGGQAPRQIRWPRPAARRPAAWRGAGPRGAGGPGRRARPYRTARPRRAATGTPARPGRWLALP